MSALIIVLALVWGLPLALLALALLVERAASHTAVDPWDVFRPDAEAWDRHVNDALAAAETSPIHDEIAVERLRDDLDTWGRGAR
jgi:hypothetical protein